MIISEEGAVIMKLKSNKTFAFLMVLVLVSQFAFVALAGGTKDAEPKQVLSSSRLSDEALLELGYVKVQVVYQNGADIYYSLEEEAEAVGHLNAAEVLWVIKTDNEEMAMIYNPDKNAKVQYIKWNDLLIIQKRKEDEEEYSARSIIVHSTLDDMGLIPFDAEIEMSAELINFLEDDIISCQWQYAEQDGEFQDIENANSLNYSYVINDKNIYYQWKIVILVEHDEE